MSSASSTVSLHDLVHLYQSDSKVKALLHLLQKGEPHHLTCAGLQASAAPLIFAALHEQLPQQVAVFILDDLEEAGYFYHDLSRMVNEEAVLFFPSSFKRAVKYGQRDAANKVLRTQTLGRLTHLKQQKGDSERLYVVTYPDALSERVPPLQDFSQNAIHLEVEQNYDLPTLEKSLKAIGFKKEDYVYQPGEFAVRGSILDIFSFSSDLPFRIDFFGDEIDTIRSFEVQSQLSKAQLKAVDIIPCGQEETALTDFTSYLPAETLLVTSRKDTILDTLQKTYEDGFSRQALKTIENLDLEYEDYAYEEDKAAAKRPSFLKKEEDADLLDKQKILTPAAPFKTAFTEKCVIELRSARQGEMNEKGQLTFDFSPQPAYHKNFDLLTTSFRQFTAEGYHLYISADSEKQIERIKDILKEKAPELQFTAIPQTIHAGFADNGQKRCVFTDHQIFDRYHKYNLKTDHTRNAKMALTLKDLMQFKLGDYVVHINHGIGKFLGLVRMPGADGEMQEMIKISYQGDDLVFVSIHALHKLSKYKGREGVEPRLSRLGTGAWQNLKDRTKKKIKDIARDLIKLYSERKESKGFAYSPDSYLQEELEASFTYEDTPDQLKVTQEVKKDMESDRPMDRLVCGDVGFGKTEIAVRAAMKAAADNKQVAVLVPTTVLALQHYKTFEKRLRNFPVKVDYLSRARTAKETRQVMQDLAEGRVDIVVGTHKLTGKNVHFKDLGLLIIDEEQKFGVSDKEKLRKLKTNVDTLTLSATPIPRTLQFSLMGARDFSVIATPPPNRRPIQTEIHTFSPEIIAEAINFEMSRNGQVYIVSHRINRLGFLKELIEKYVPDARVVVGHGQMSPTELEKKIIDFVNYDYDVLISTTIIENGIDIPNANTIIIDAAHHFGLSDLHQMRGRVGRSGKQAFCYLLAPVLSNLNIESKRRLQAIEDFSDLGSGIHIAMQDLDIRGAGNLLGAEQSGFIADLGYETYQKILAEAMAELHNEYEEVTDDSARPAAPSKNSEQDGNAFVSECNIDCDFHAYFPETYVPGSSERMLLYRQLDTLTSPEQLEEFKKAMLDRFGPLPEEAEELLRIVPLRKEGRRLGVERLVLQEGRMTLYFVSTPQSPFFQTTTFESIIRYASNPAHHCALGKSALKPHLIIRGIHSVKSALDTLNKMAPTGS